MVKILQDNTPPSTAQRFAQAFQSAGAAIPKALHDYEKDKERAEKKLALRKSKLRPALKTQLSLYDKDNKFFQSNPHQMARLEELTGKYFDSGLDAEDAVKLAYQDITSSAADKTGTMGTTRTNAGESTGDRLKGESPQTINEQLSKKIDHRNEDRGKQGTLEDLKRKGAKIGRAVLNVFDFPFHLAKEGPLGFGAKISPRGYHGGKFDTLTDMYDKATGGLGIPENWQERVASGAVLGVPGVVAAGAQEGLAAIDAPRWVQEAGGLVAFLFTHKAQIPVAKSLLKETKIRAEKSGKPPESILKEAMKETGVTEEQIASGNESSIRALKDKITEAPESSSKVKMTPKTVFNKKAAFRQREAFGAKLSESPLESHYEIESKNSAKESGKGPEVRAREAEIRERLAPEEKKLFEDIRNKQEQLVRIEKERFSATDPESKARLNTHYDYQAKAIQEATDKLKDVQYQMKYGRARPTAAEVDAQINKSIKSYEEGIENPTEKSIKDVKKQLEIDKDYIDRAQKILDRGELPGDIRPDTFIKMKDKYLKSYKAAIKEARDTIQSLKGEKDVASIRKIRQKQDLIETLSGRVKRLEADIVNQTDKLKALGALNKPSGAFYKNQLKSLKKDQALFKHDLFENKMVKNPIEAKADSAFKKTQESFKQGEKVAKDPSSENIKQISEETKVPEKDITDHLKRGREEAQGFQEKIDKGTVTPKTIKDFLKWTKKFPKFLRPTTAKQYARLLATGMGVGMVQGLIAEATGHKLDAKYIRYLSYALGTGTFGTTAGGYHLVENFFTTRQAEKLNSLKHDPQEWNNYLNKIRTYHGKSRAEKVRKESNQL